MIETEDYELEMTRIETDLKANNIYKHPITGLFFKTKNKNMRKISTEDDMRTITDSLAYYVFV